MREGLARVLGDQGHGFEDLSHKNKASLETTMAGLKGQNNPAKAVGKDEMAQGVIG